ncbi:hypothetical protein NA78x_004138 [Anatilimnocola sp. NA78]|uniref:hypothetical protein n=1 Tax=Anatilimnocola sp. NA78 TaxID=3415683 RepID=UPI003CE53B37
MITSGKELNQRSRFIAFLARVAEGNVVAADWNEFVVTRYAEADLEAARGRLSRAALLGGQCSAEPANASLRQVAAGLLGEFDT